MVEFGAVLNYCDIDTSSNCWICLVYFEDQFIQILRLQIVSFTFTELVLTCEVLITYTGF